MIKQYQRLLKMDDVELEFTDESLIAIAEAALRVTQVPGACVLS